MAAALSVEKLEKELFCAVCMNVLSRPKHLSSCDHTFCEDCLQMVASAEGEGNSRLKCPMCREMSTLPEKGVSGLKSNPLICRILDVLKTKQGSGKKGCDSCGDNDSPLITYCRDCFQLICQSCTESHERMKLQYRNHRTVLLSDIHNGKVKIGPLEDYEKMNEYKCAKHDWEFRSFFCKTCEQRICRDCVVLEHNKDGHDCTTMRQIFFDMQEKMGRLRDSCRQRKEEIKWAMNSVDVKERGTAKKFQELRESVSVATLAAVSYLKEAEVQLLLKVCSLERAFKRNVQLSRDQVSGLTDKIDRLMSQADRILATKEAPEFSPLPDDLMKKMEELLAEEYKVTAIDDLLAMKGTSIQSHHLSLTMSSYADVVLSGVWQVNSTIKVRTKSLVRVFCNNTHVIMTTQSNVYKRLLDVEGSGWPHKLLSVQNNQCILAVAVSFNRDQVMYTSFRDNTEMGIRMVRISEINGGNGSYSSYEEVNSVTPPCWSNATEMMTTDCTGRIIIVENQMLPPVFSTSSEFPKLSSDQIQGTSGSACAAPPVLQSYTVPVQACTVSTCSTGSVTTNTVSGSTAVRTKVRVRGEASAPRQKTNLSEKIGAISFRSAKVYRHRPNCLPPVIPVMPLPRSRTNGRPKRDSFEVPFGVASVAAAKTGQLAFLREDKKAIVITDEDGRVQHEIKEPGRMYLSISCTESDALYVLSALSGSHTVTLTKHSLEDGGLLEYVIDKLDAPDGVTADKRPIIENYGNDRVIINVGKEIRIYARKEWRVLDYESDDSDL